MPIGTIPTSSGRSDGEAGGRVSAEESGVAVRGVTFSDLVWAEMGKLNSSVINKKHPEKGGLFIKRRESDFRICKPSQPLRCSYKRL